MPISASCALAPCHGVVELREAETGQLLGRLRFAFTRAGMTPGRIVVPAWAMARMRIGAHIRVKLTYDVREGDATKEHLLLITRLHVRTGTRRERKAVAYWRRSRPPALRRRRHPLRRGALTSRLSGAPPGRS